MAPVLDGRQASASVTIALCRRDGREVMIEALVQCPTDQYGERRHYIAVVRDIDERIRRDDAVHAAHEFLALAEDRERIARDLHDNVIQRLFGGGLTPRLGLCPDAGGRSGAGRGGDRPTRRHHKRAAQRRLRPRRKRWSRRGSARRDRTDLPRGQPDDRKPDRRSSSSDRSISSTRLCDRSSSQTLREALSNIARHAQATRAAVEITVGEQIHMRITDDGIGLPDGDVIVPGNGLRNLAARARALGGSFDICATSGVGTALTWMAPT